LIVKRIAFKSLTMDAISAMLRIAQKNATYTPRYTQIRPPVPPFNKPKMSDLEEEKFER
jgi:hypothetical protein